MPSASSWEAMVKEGRNKCHYSSRDLSTAEKAAGVAFDARMREMAKTGQGVIAHDGNGQKAVLISAIALLAVGAEDEYQQAITRFMEKAAFDPIHYSAISYGLQAADGYLKQHRR